MSQERTVLNDKSLAPVLLMSFGHGATHYAFGTLIILVPFIKQALGLTYTQAGLIVSTFHVTAFFANFVAGLAVDMTGRRILFAILSVLICCISMLALGFFTPLLIICFLAGVLAIGVQAWHPAAFSFLAEDYEDMKGIVFSIHVIAANISEAVAFQIGGLIVTLVGSWKLAAMTGAVPSIIAAILLIVFLLPKEKRVGEKLNMGMELKTYLNGYTSLLVNIPAMMVCFVSSLRTMAQNGLLVFIPLYLIDSLGVSAALMGTALLAMQIAGGVATPIGGYTSDRFGPRPVLSICTIITSIAIILATRISDPTTYIVVISLVGFVLFAMRPVLQRWIVDLVPGKFRGSATSLMFSMQAVGNALIPIVGGWIADSRGMLSVFYFLGAIMLGANVLTFFLPKSNPANEC